ncbi:MAG: beta-propeller domain-containing protein [Cellvibrio sp.]|uniref:beta-propeller domain-containing protein n=1 Tax=Cellvibrio sp. TaxID=1965322 RepID=UPI00271F1220|nr:beta-propeller domain-containing protein [Cellvibrio sp.]
MKPMVKIALLSLPLVACGGGSNSQHNIQKELPVNTDYSALSESQLEPGPLRQASANELSELVKNGLRVSLRQNQSYGMMIRETAVTDTNNTLDNKSGGGDFSGTNVQIANVDEADSVKYDGKYIYLATPTEYTNTGATASLKILATDPANASVSEVSDTPLDTEHWGSVSEMYLVDSTQGTTGVATIRRSWDFIAFADKVVNDVSADGKPLVVDEADTARNAMIWPYQMDNGIEITLFDVRTPTTPTKSWSMSIDGDLLSTRKIGNTLYIISSFVPSVPTLDYAAETKDAKIANEELIIATQIEKLLPEYSINGGSPQPLNSANGCMIPASTAKNDGHLNLINITAINLSSQQLIESVCVNSNVETVYASTESIYLVGSDYSHWESWQSFSVVHRFALNTNGVDYSATGSVEGVLGWSSPSFRMDEHNGVLRMVTTNYGEAGEPVHQLSILQKANGRSELEVIAQLPNKTQPEAIGKPREDIYGVRFNGDKAYVVTFERKDPLYVLDLANPLAPKIAGQLEVPGFSTYLHPIGDNYLFALGNDATSDGIATGVKVALYDISNPAQPTEISNHVFGSAYSWSEALYDHRALSFLNASADQLRITLPVTLYEEVKTDEFVSVRWANTSLYQFEVNGLADGKLSLDHVGVVVGESSENQEYPFWGGNDRGILHGDALFYVHGPKVIAGPWKKAD